MAGIDAHKWAQAERDTKSQRARVQGFFYPHKVDVSCQTPVEDLPGSFVVRDFNQPRDKETCWRLDVIAGGYRDGHELLEIAGRVREIELISSRYEEILMEGQT